MVVSGPLAVQHITDEDVLALVNDEVHQPPSIWVLQDLQVNQRLQTVVNVSNYKAGNAPKA